tara:strand:+ start:95 stop:1222 length:1128 start_codon:yes stop_codon:yes gene_type:complete
MNKRIYLSPPHMGEREKQLFLDAFNSNWIAPVGPDLDDFEKEMMDYLKIENACAVSSGTSALHLALIVLGINKNDKILCPSLTFSASANVILYQNATPVFVDVNPFSWTVDLNLLEVAIKKHKPRAIICVDLYGQSCDYNSIIDLCKKYNVFLIEDAAEALGSEYNGRKCGTFGDISILSFNGNKIITTSGGGMLLSKNKDYVDKARFFSTQSREPAIHYEHKEIGYNYRLSNLLAAIGRGQLKLIDDRVNRRRSIFKRYFDSLSSINGFDFLTEIKNTKSNRWLTTLIIDPKKAGIDNKKIIYDLEKENIESRPVWKPMHLQNIFKDYDFICNPDQDVSSYLFDNGICLPSGSNLDLKDQEKIIEIILSSINKS